MKSRIFVKLLGAFLVVIALATVTLDIAVRKSWEQSLYNEIEKALIEKVTLFANTVERERDRRSLQEIATEVSAAADARATIIDPQGRVLADTRANPAEMENHATRPEFIAALHGRIGTATRTSHTVGIPFLYVAAPISGGAVRLAYPLASIQQMTRHVRIYLLEASLVALLLAAVLAALIAQAMARRLRRILDFAEHVAAGDLTARLAVSWTDELGLVAAALDRTTRQLERSFAEIESSHRQLETLLNSMQDAVLAVNNDSRIAWSNGPMNRLGRVTAGTAVTDCVRDPNALAAIDSALKDREVRVARATSLVPGRTFAVTAAPLAGGGAVAVLHDDTEIQRVERTRRDFIANVSHELRTPLTSIQGYAETLLDLQASGAADPGAMSEFLEIIRKNAARMARLTEDLLVLARVESGEQRFHFRTLSPVELLEDARESFRQAPQAAEVQLAVISAARAPVRADLDAVHQVFANLIDNAVKYGGGGRIEIGARDAENGVEFYVRDFGAGIASEHLPRLFERFYRVDKARSRESGGTGLGLAIAKHIVLAHGGTIRVTSELNHGATFSFVLPAAVAAETAGFTSG